MMPSLSIPDFPLRRIVVSVLHQVILKPKPFAGLCPITKPGRYWDFGAKKVEIRGGQE